MNETDTHGMAHANTPKALDEVRKKLAREPDVEELEDMKHETEKIMSKINYPRKQEEIHGK